jgi:hypothetical protein
METDELVNSPGTCPSRLPTSCPMALRAMLRWATVCLPRYGAHRVIELTPPRNV